MIVCTVSESAVKTVNFGNEIGSGSDSPSDVGEELRDPDPLGLWRGVTKMVPETLNVNTFLEGGSKSLILIWMVRGTAGGLSPGAASTLFLEGGRVSSSGVA